MFTAAAHAEEPKPEPASVSGARTTLPIAVSTYSFWRFRDDAKLPVAVCIDKAAELGFDAVELLHIQMEADDQATLRSLRRRAFLNGLPICGLSTHQTFVSPDTEVRKQNVAHTIRCIEIADALGAPTIRVPNRYSDSSMPATFCRSPAWSRESRTCNCRCLPCSAFCSR